MGASDQGQHLPPPGSTVHRDTARVLPVNTAGQVLLLHGWDPNKPDEPFWFTVGGATESGESLAEAAARELTEETGISVPLEELGSPLARSTIEFSWGGYCVVQRQTFFAVAVDSVSVTFAGQDHWERATIDDYRWWSPDELERTGAAAAPGIPDLMREAVAAVGNSA